MMQYFPAVLLYAQHHSKSCTMCLVALTQRTINYESVLHFRMYLWVV